MPEPFKNRLNETVIAMMAEHLARAWPQCGTSGFVDAATAGLDRLELKQRSSQITDALERHLPGDYAKAVDVLVASLDPQDDLPIGELEAGAGQEGIRGWPVMAMADFVARRGMDDVGLSLRALKEMTSRFSAEFAIRPFLVQHPAETLATLESWSTDANEHVRRLVSEGTRPRLPWGMRLAGFVVDPTPVVDLIERLKDDPSEYVRRSVANNLNDIAKDHPDLVVDIARRWLAGASQDRKRLVRHALRSLIKAGHPGALEALGYGPADVDLVRFDLQTPVVPAGGTLEFTIELASPAASDQPLIIDYAVHHQRANGTLSPKVFKWKTVTLKPGETLSATKRHSFRPVTTRRTYPGRHRIEVQVNGTTIAGADFELAAD